MNREINKHKKIILNKKIKLIQEEWEASKKNKKGGKGKKKKKGKKK